MKETNIVHIKPAEKSETAGFDLLERLVAEEKPVTGREIKKYVDGIVSELKKLTSQPEREHFLKRLAKKLFGRNQPAEKEDKKITAVVGGLENETAIDEYQFKHISSKVLQDEKDELKAGMNRIRSAVAEELKQRLTKEAELGQLNYSDVNLLASFFDIAVAPHERRVGRVEDLYKQAAVFKKTSEKEFFNKSELKIHHAALQKFSKLEPHDNVVAFREFDLHGVKTIVEELKLKTVKDLLKNESTPLAEILKAVKDCLSGAIFLEKNGLILQDISIDNLGVIEEEEKNRGLLFDFDGLYLADAGMNGRMGKMIYFPPEAIIREETPVKTSEMVYQFGICLKAVFGIFKSGLPQEEWDRAEQLIKKMISFEVNLRYPMQNRVSLEEAKNKLEDLILEVEKLDKETV